jgi:SAM-dependent methyltransferase
MGAVHKPRVLTYDWTKNGGQVTGVLEGSVDPTVFKNSLDWRPMTNIPGSGIAASKLLSHRRSATSLDENPTTSGSDRERIRAHHLRERRKSDNEQYLEGLLSPLGIAEDSTVLDAGCGSGYVNNYLASRMSLKHNIGFDIDPDAIRLARELETEPDGILWFCASGLEIPLRDSSVDHLICRGLVPLVPVNQLAAEIGRIIRPSGTAVMLLHPWTFYLPLFSLRLQDWKKSVAAALIILSSLWFNLTGWEIPMRFGRHRISMSFQTEYRMRRVFAKHGLSIYRVARAPDFLIYVRSNATPAS